MGDCLLSRAQIYNTTIKIPRGVDTSQEYVTYAIDCIHYGLFFNFMGLILNV